MVGSWVIGIALRWANNGVQTLLATEGATLRADRALSRYQRRIAEVQAAQLKAGTMVAGGMFAVGAAVIALGIRQAAQFQLAMTSVGAATGATAKELEKLQAIALHTAGVTAQSPVTIAREMATAATSGLNTISRLTYAFPQMARAADAMWLSPKHIDPNEAARQMSQLSHLFGAYSGKPLHEMIDQATRLMFTQPENLQAAVTQGRIFIGPALRYGVSMDDIFSQLMTMGQTGWLRGRGGSGLARYMEYLMGAPEMTAHLSKARRSAMEDLGVFDSSGRNRFIRRDGTLDLLGSIRYFAGVGDRMTAQHQQARFTTDLMNAFLAQGGRYIATITLPKIMSQVQQNRTAAARLAPPGQAVEVLWKKYMSTTAASWSKFVTNLQYVSDTIFLPVLPQVTTVFNDLAVGLSNVGDFLGAHRTLARDIGDVAIAMTALAGVRFALGGAMMLGRAFGMFRGISSGMGIFAKALTFLDNFAFMGLGGKIVSFGIKLAGLEGPETQAAKGLTAIGASINTLAGARTAALGLSALGGAITAVASTLGVIYGIYKDIEWMKRSPANAKLGGWMMSGANYGLPNPAPSSAPVVHQHVTVQLNLPKGSDMSNARLIMQYLKSLAGGAFTSPNYNIAPGAYNSVPLHP